MGPFWLKFSLCAEREIQLLFLETLETQFQTECPLKQALL